MAEIEALLRSRYPANTHTLLFEVRNDAGFRADRSCDALAMGLWPSRGLKLSGFEIKRSRADWLKEYRQPEKAESFSVFCDEWWIVAGDGSIVQADELPERWGLLVAKGQRLECVKPAPKNPTPEPLDRGLLAAMFKRAQSQFAAPAKAEYQRGYEAGIKHNKEGVQQARENATRELQDLKKSVYDFEKASGVTIHSWDGQRIGEAVRIVLNGGHKQHALRIESMLTQARTLITSLESLKELSK